MSTYEMEQQKKIFAENLRYFLELADKTQTDLQRYLKVSSSTVSDWIHGAKMPRMDKIQSICNWLGIQKSDLLEEKSRPPKSDYYVDPETIELAQELYQNPEMHMLFDAVRTSSASDLKNFYDMIMLMKRRENPDG